MSQELRFDGKVVVVTGAGNGLGRSHALLFARRGASVVVNDLGGGRHGEGRSSKAADAVVEEIKAFGGKAVANADSVEDGDKIIQTALDAFGRVDVVVNNAGILRDSSFPKMTQDDWDLIYRVHLLGAYRVTKAAWDHMREQGYGRVIFTSSAAGLYGNFGQANYAMAKMGLVGLGQTLALEGAKRNIQVNIIAPVAGSRLTETVLPPDIVAALKPEYVSPLVAWLCHESCEENGSIFEVGGGFHAKLRWERTVGKVFPVGREITPEQVKASWATITDFSKTTHPENVNAALQTVLANLDKKSKGGNEFIDVDAALGYTVDGLESTYDERDLALYALGVGAGKNPTDERDLKLVYERNNDGFFALPTYGVIPAINAILDRAAKGESAPGLNYGFDRILHGEQTTEVLRPLPTTKTTLVHKMTVSEIWDKGKNAVVVFHVESRDKATGTLLLKNDISMVVRGAGGWGGERGPSGDVNVPPERAPDVVTTEKIGENQALLYRLSGDWNPLHVDPGFAAAFGFERPILHGLCTFGIVGRHVINAFCGGDPRLFKKIKVRFADSVYPGETLKTEMWKDGDRVIVRASVVERDKVVLSNAAVELHKEIPKDEPLQQSAPTAPPPSSTGPESVDVFAGLKTFVEQNPEAAKKAGFVYRFTLKNPDSVWTLDLKNGAVVAGGAAKADCTLEMQDSDFMAMVSGKADPQKLFTTGKLKIGGNIMASQKLEVLMKLDKAVVENAWKARTAAAAPSSPAPSIASSGPISVDVFAALAAFVAQNPEAAKKAGFVYRFTLKNPDSVWTLDLKNGAVVADGAAKADCTLEMQDSDFMAMVSGKADPQKLFTTGKLKIGGNIMASQKLEVLMKLDKKLVEQATATRLGAPSSSPAPSSLPSSSSSPSPATAAAPKIIAALKERLAKTPKLADEVRATIALKVKDPDAVYGIELERGPGNVVEGAPSAPTTTLTIADADLLALAKGEATVRALYQHGQLRIDGDVQVAHRLGFLTKLV